VDSGDSETARAREDLQHGVVRAGIDLLKTGLSRHSSRRAGKPASVPATAGNTEVEAELFCHFARRGRRRGRNAMIGAVATFRITASRTRPRYPRRAGEGPGGRRGNRRAG
jgi:hypothetical protein